MATKRPTATVRAEVPVRLLQEMESLVDTGWFRDLDEVVVGALRRFVESHRADLLESFVHEDMEWGLRGAD